MSNLNKKSIQVGASSMLAFKAELYKKQEEFNRIRQSSDTSLGTSLIGCKRKLTTKFEPPIKTNPGVDKRAAKDASEKAKYPDEDTPIAERLERSRAALETKSRLYDALKNGHGNGERSKHKGDAEYLVDFDKKAVDEREGKKRRSSGSGDDDFVEYVDALGRSRKCHRDELKDHKRRDEELQRDINDRETDRDEASNQKEITTDNTFHRLDTKEVVDSETPIRDIHYEDLRANEIRTHGVAYYSFSRDEEERQQQMEELEVLRRQTEAGRARSEAVRAKREAILQQRLDRVRARRGLPTPTPLEPDVACENGQTASIQSDSKETISSSVSDLIGQQISALRAETDCMPSAVPPMREWDRGKLMPQKDYEEREREKRNLEFAPPSLYD